MSTRTMRARSGQVLSAGRFLLAGAAAAVSLGVAFGAMAQDNVAAGARVWQSRGDCQACHGWAGDGKRMDNQMPVGANIRETTTLDRDQLIEVIRCGRPGTGMPAFERNAYSDGRCYGMTTADLRAAGLTMFDAGQTLQMREIEAVADFLLAKMIGQGPLTRAECIEFWNGEDRQVCQGLPE